MNNVIAALTERPAWALFATIIRAIKHRQLRELFAQDPKRGERLALEAAGIYLDYSKNLITDETLGLLVQLAEESGLGVADRGDVRRRQDQCVGASRGASCRIACAAG